MKPMEHRLPCYNPSDHLLATPLPSKLPALLLCFNHLQSGPSPRAPRILRIMKAGVLCKTWESPRAFPVLLHPPKAMHLSVVLFRDAGRFPAFAVAMSTAYNTPRLVEASSLRDTVEIIEILVRDSTVQVRLLGHSQESNRGSHACHQSMSVKDDQCPRSFG